MSLSNPSVSVVIPVYGRETLVKDAIESVLIQNFKPVEILIIDDGSPKSLEQSLIPYFPLIKYIKNNKNYGVSYSRNVGIKEAKGDYIAFLDSDDIWLPNKLKHQIEKTITKGYQICHTNEFWYKAGKWINQSKKHTRYGGKIFDKVLDMCRVSPSSLLVSKEVFNHIGYFDEKLLVCEDYEFILRAALHYEIGYIEDKLLIKRAISDDQLSKSIQYIESIRLNILENFSATHIVTDKSYKDALYNEIQRKKSIVRVSPFQKE